MPNYITLISLADGTNPEFAALDDQICAEFGWEPHPQYFAQGWYDSILGRLASGCTWSQVRANLKFLSGSHPEIARDLLKVTDWLEERYTYSAGYSAR